MDRQSAAAVGAAAEEHRLGDLISVHRGERPLIRARARWGWLLGGGLLAGLGLIAVSGTGTDFGGYALGIIGVHLLIVVVIGPVAARLFPPAGPPRAVVLYEHGLIDVVGSRVARVVRFDQVRHVEQQRGYEYSDGRMFRASAAVARLTAEIDGRTVTHEYAGYRRQDRFIDEIRARRAGAPRRAASTAARRKGGVTYGGLVIGKRGMSVVPGADGLQPAERPDLPWNEVTQVNERADGRLSIYRRTRPGEPATPGDLVLWFSAVVPDTSEVAALVTAYRNKAAGG